MSYNQMNKFHDYELEPNKIVCYTADVTKQMIV